MIETEKSDDLLKSTERILGELSKLRTLLIIAVMLALFALYQNHMLASSVRVNQVSIRNLKKADAKIDLRLDVLETVEQEDEEEIHP